MGPEVHIAGIFVHVTPDRVAAASASIARLSGAELHATDARGKLVVTLEAASSVEILGQLEAMRRIDGVLAALLVYQHAESVEAMSEEVSDEDLAT